MFGNFDRELNMVTASIEVSGPDAERLARELRATLAAAAEPGDSVSVVEVQHSAELVIALIGLELVAGSPVGGGERHDPAGRWRPVRSVGGGPGAVGDRT